jgi:hypothetical protein
MMQLIIILPLIITAFLLNSCASSQTKVAPSQNAALNTISKSNASKEKEGAMQKSLNSWLHDDWGPTVAKDKEIRKKYMHEGKKQEVKTSVKETQESHYIDKENKNFTLQEYVDKAAAYMRAKPNDYNSSNVHKLESMPVIGK